MDKLKVELENCYGIKKMNHNFDFSDGNNTKIIYAPNGIMKSSFANTLDDFSKGIYSKDRISPEIESIRIIQDETKNDVLAESIFVIKPLEKSFKTDKISTLLVNSNLKEEYDKTYSEISGEIEKLIKKIQVIAGLRKDVVKTICSAFNKEEKNFIDLLVELESSVNNALESTYRDIKFNDIFDGKILSLIKTAEFQKYIVEYIKKYDELVSKSKVFRKGFNHNNASTVQKQLKDNGYFNANHTVMLNVEGAKIEISNAIDLSRKFSEEQNKIFEDDELKTTFEKIDKKLTNSQLKNFRDLLLDNQNLLPELSNIKELEKKIWISYFKENLEQFNIVLSKYKEGQTILKTISEKAKNERTDWEKVVEIFNNRFYVPYKLEIENKEDSIVKEVAPNIKYYFEDKAQRVEEDLLWDVLSQGEKRTLYLLNIIFEIESRKNEEIETVFIVDDIADSFDYKNKYAIIEYLKDISMNPAFKLIILTHNFDFLRTVQDRICIGKAKYSSSFMAVKEEECIKLEDWKYNYISNPLKFWKKELGKPSYLIASITFARNLAEYIGDKDSGNKLTSVLHIKKTSPDLTVKDLEDIYKVVFKDVEKIDLEDKSKKIFDIIMEVSKEIADNGIEKVNLEEKIVLSIAIRLLAEDYMILKIDNESFTSSITTNQTGALFKKFKELPNIEDVSLEILERVSIMTPENIHLNSFMFEPILDLSNYHLIKLYQDISSLLSEEKSVIAVV